MAKWWQYQTRGWTSPRSRNLLLVVLGLCAAVYLAARPKLCIIQGDCMAPAYHDGDLVLLLKHLPLHKDDVVAAWSRGDLVFHRVIYVSYSDDLCHVVYVIAGDNNVGETATRVAPAQIVGKVVCTLRCVAKGDEQRMNYDRSKGQ